MRQANDFRQAKEIESLYNDVCSTCNDVEICTGRKNKQGPVWFCEEFDDYVAVMDKKSVGSEFQIIPPWKGSHHPDAPIRFRGLCINCENRKTCVNTRVERGIWHCEEYC